MKAEGRFRMFPVRVALLLSLVWLLIVSFASAQQPGSKSEHHIVISGTSWGSVVSEKEKELKEAIVTDVGSRLLRKYDFLTVINVTSVSASEKSLGAHVTVVQTLLKGSSSHLHIWPPDEANSMIMQSGFTNTLNLYTASDDPTLVTVRIPMQESGIDKLDEWCTKLLTFGIYIAGAMVILLVFTLLWMCCKCSSRKVTREEYKEDCDGKIECKQK